MLPSSGSQKRFENDQRKAKQANLSGNPAAQGSVRTALPTGRVLQRTSGGGGQGPSNVTSGPAHPLQGPLNQELPPLDLSQLSPTANVPTGLDALNPATPSVDYEAINREVAMEQLLSSPQVQESVARAKLKQYFKNRNGGGVQDSQLDLGFEVLKDLRQFM